MPKPKIKPPPPLLASAADRKLAAETILKGYTVAHGDNLKCCDIPILAGAVLLARHEMAMQEDRKP